MRPATKLPLGGADGERRLRVVGDHVVCRRIGPTEVHRCPECVYLLRLGTQSIVCRGGELPDQPDFVW